MKYLIILMIIFSNNIFCTDSEEVPDTYLSIEKIWYGGHTYIKINNRPDHSNEASFHDPHCVCHQNEKNTETEDGK